MSKHTPTPWQSRINGTSTGRGPEIITIDSDGWEREIASLECTEVRGGFRRKWNRTKDADEIEANANLIVVAPELLAVLCEARDMLRDLPDEDDSDYLTKLVARCDAAIAKAEGRKP